MFNVDPEKFFKAASSLSDAAKDFIKVQEITKDLKLFPSEFAHTAEINQIILDIDSTRNDVGEIERKISNTKDKLCSLDNEFAEKYQALSSRNIFGLDIIKIEEQLLNMSKTVYEKYLLEYLEKIKSEGIDVNNFYESIKSSCYDKIKLDNKGLFVFDSKVSYSGIISDFTDYQNCLTAELNTNFINKVLNNTDYDYKGKTLYELYESGIFNGEFLSNIVSIISSGFGDFKVVEVIKGEAGFDCTIFQDVDGNYLLCFPCTSLDGNEDVIYDVEHILSLDLTDILKTFDITDISASHSKQKKQAIEIGKKYFELAKKNGKKLNISGYSLGGSLAEETYLNLCNKNIFNTMYEDLFSKNIFNTRYEDCDTIGNLIIYDGLHKNMMKNQGDFIKEQNEKGKIKIYNAEGSTVSSYYGYEYLKDVATPVYVNYKGKYAEKINYNLDWVDGVLNSKLGNDYINFNLNTALKSYFGEEGLEKLKLVINNHELIYSGAAHAASNPRSFDNISFDEKGNARKVVIVEDENGNSIEHNIKNMKFGDITKDVFGTDMSDAIKLVDDLKTIVNIAEETTSHVKEGEILSLGDDIKSMFDNRKSIGEICDIVFASGAIEINTNKIIDDAWDFISFWD